MTVVTSRSHLRAVQPGASSPQIVSEYLIEWFAGHDQIVAPIRRHLTIVPEHCQTLIDIGTRDGAVLDDVASRLPQFKKLIGITVDQDGLKKTQARTSHDSRLSFHQGDPWTWLRQARPQGAIIFGYHNLSMLPETLIEDKFLELIDWGAIGIALIEPQRGGCTNLPAMLKRCGWIVRHAEKRDQAGRPWWNVFASLQRRAKLPGAIQ